MQFSEVGGDGARCQFRIILSSVEALALYRELASFPDDKNGEDFPILSKLYEKLHRHI